MTKFLFLLDLFCSCVVGWFVFTRKCQLVKLVADLHHDLSNSNFKFQGLKRSWQKTLVKVLKCRRATCEMLVAEAALRGNSETKINDRALRENWKKNTKYCAKQQATHTIGDQEIEVAVVENRLPDCGLPHKYNNINLIQCEVKQTSAAVTQHVLDNTFNSSDPTCCQQPMSRWDIGDTASGDRD